jgi:hypothetical protein
MYPHWTHTSGWSKLTVAAGQVENEPWAMRRSPEMDSIESDLS